MFCANCVSCAFDNPNIPADAYEIHITVDNARQGEFSAAAKLIGAKPVLIAMQNEAGAAFHHLMTSKTVRGAHCGVRRIADRDAEFLTNKGFYVSRVKIETTLTNPIACIREHGGYFESHIEILIPKEDLPRGNPNAGWFDIEDKVTRVNPALRLSKNAFKEYGEKVSYFATVRKSDPSWTPRLFNDHVNDTVEGLREYFETGKVRSEYAFYDSNIDLDKDWK